MKQHFGRAFAAFIVFGASFSTVSFAQESGTEEAPASPVADESENGTSADALVEEASSASTEESPAAEASSGEAPSEKNEEKAKNEIKPVGESAEVKEPLKDAPSYHKATPVELAERLRLSLGLGFGGGYDSKMSMSLDYAAYEVAAQYRSAPVHFLQHAHYTGELRYKTMTGVSARGEKKSDKSYVIQAFGMGAGMEYLFPDIPKTRLIGLTGVSLLKIKGREHATGRRSASRYGASGELTVRAAYGVFERVEAYGGIGVQLGTVSWFDAQIGVMGAF